METERRSSRAGRPLGTLFRVCSAAWLLLQLSTPSRAFSTPPVYKVCIKGLLRSYACLVRRPMATASAHWDEGSVIRATRQI